MCTSTHITCICQLQVYIVQCILPIIKTSLIEMAEKDDQITMSLCVCLLLYSLHMLEVIVHSVLDLNKPIETSLPTQSVCVCVCDYRASKFNCNARKMNAGV